MDVKHIIKILDEYFPNPKPVLRAKNSFTFLIAVMLSAQTTDVRVNEVTEVLFKLASTPKKMLAIGLKKIESIIKPCGFYHTKAKAVVNLSKMLLEKFDGKVPKTFEDLESLPGVGHKTASVVMCQVWGKPAFPVDTHIKRCAKRWGLSKSLNVKDIEKDLKEVFPQKSWCKLHLQIVLFARKFCKARGHKIDECPICSHLKSGPLST